MTIATLVEVLDIRHFNARQLRPLLEHEAAVWEERLRWDYHSSTELLLQYLDSKVLPGFVALDRGRICGYCFCVYEGQKAVVGDVYAIAAATDSAADITRLLLRHLLEVLLHSPTVQRIESQLLLYSAGVIDDIFAESGFQLYPRLFMECSLGRPANGAPAPELLEAAQSLPAGLAIRRWSNLHYQAAAELIHLSYLGHLDSSINDQYRSLHGSLRFLHNIVRFPGCGVFEPEASWLLIDRKTGQLAGMALCSRVSEQVAHITQLCVGPQFRRLGLGRVLLRHSMDHMAALGFDAITLTVTEGNEPAVRLYREMGFFIRQRFEAMVRELP